MDHATQQHSPLGASAVTALNHLIRSLTRRHGTLSAAGYPDSLWQWIAYLQCTYMLIHRNLMVGLAAEESFRIEAQRRCKLINNLSSSPSTSSKSTPSNTSAPNWKICPCCAQVNDHLSTACPSQASGPSRVPESTRTAVKAVISVAPISATTRDNLLRMATALWAKIDRQL